MTNFHPESNASQFIDELEAMLTAKGRQVEVTEEQCNGFVMKSLFAPAPVWYDHAIMAHAIKRDGGRWAFKGLTVLLSKGKLVEKTRWRAEITADTYS